jgi:hypothetical protein
MSQEKIIDELIEPKQAHRFAAFIFNENLDLSRQNLTDKDMIDLIHFLMLHPKIKTLNLSLNNIGDQGIADFAERNLTVTQVNFAGNIISDSGAAVFAYKNRVIEQVNFSLNPISEKGVDNFCELNEVCHASIFSKVRLH